MLEALFVLASEMSLQQNQKNLKKKKTHMLRKQKIAKCGKEIIFVKEGQHKHMDPK